jgi:hypothetical protein
MAILRGHEDLQHKAIVGFDMGFALVQCGESVKRYRMTVGPMGNLHAEPVEETQQGPDQLMTVPEQEARARRFAGVDQIT